MDGNLYGMVATERSATLVAIARDEGRYIVEWLAHHLAIGFSRIIVYDHGSVDSMPAYIDRIAAVDRRIRRIPWQVTSGSPQVQAYNAALRRVATPWVAFLDIDEFLIPEKDGSLPAFIGRIPDDVSCVHINWRGFADGGRESDDYELVTRTFMMSSKNGWGNHHHVKSLARTAQVSNVLVHDVDIRSGRYVQCDFQDSVLEVRGLAQRICYEGIQINHYQCKTYKEFEKRMLRGSANWSAGELGGVKDATRARFDELNRNHREDTAILQFDTAFRAEYDVLKRLADG